MIAMIKSDVHNHDGDGDDRKLKNVNKASDDFLQTQRLPPCKLRLECKYKLSLVGVKK